MLSAEKPDRYCAESISETTIGGVGVRLRFCVQIDEEPVALTPRERWTRELDKGQALLALARPTSVRRRTKETSAPSNDEPSEQESSAGPEHSRHSTSAGKRALRLAPQEMKCETSSERMMKSYKEGPRPVAVKKVRSFCEPQD